MPNEVLHKLLIRLCDQRMNEKLGLLINDAVRRPVTFQVRTEVTGLADTRTLDGLVLIGPDEGPNGVEDIRRHIGECMIKVLSTAEVWWIPTRATRDPVTAFWSIECVPLIDFTRISSKSDDFILGVSGYDVAGNPVEVPPPAGGPRPTGWLCGACGEPNRTAWSECHSCNTPQQQNRRPTL
jgi:hypothetical protein